MPIVPFRDDLIPEAGTLLAQRHQRDRTRLPQLPARFEDAVAAGKAVEAALKRNQASGLAMMSGGRMLGYMLGDLQIDNLRGRSAWIRTAGCALAPDEPLELLGELYAALGERWVSTYGCFDHFVLVPIADPALVHLWFMLSFGVQQVHALKALEALEPAGPPDMPGIEVRRAGPDDRQALIEMSDIIWRHQIEAPVWGIMPPENVAETREGWAELVDDASVAVYLAFCQGKAVACQGYFPGEAADDNLLLPERCARLSVAGTREAVRGKGIQRALAQLALAWLKAGGYPYCETDWRSTNLLAARAWPRHGYQPVGYRLHRHVDSRILWARGPESGD
jgi:GNAT superfamily N-acetyltransferase